MPGRSKYIDGIFNYCDSWCERCAFASRCRNFAMQRSLERRVEKKERENAAFWEALEKTLGESIDPAIKEADQLFGDVKNEHHVSDSDPAAFEGLLLRDRPERSHPLGKRSN
jgi:hypothetical protein